MRTTGKHGYWGLPAGGYQPSLRSPWLAAVYDLSGLDIGAVSTVCPIDQVCLRPRDRFWDIPVPKIDWAFDNLLVPQPSWSPSTTQQLRKLVAAPYLPPNDWTPRLDAYFASPLAQGTPGKTVRPRGYWGLPASASLSMAGSEGSWSGGRVGPFSVNCPKNTVE